MEQIRCDLSWPLPIDRFVCFCQRCNAASLQTAREPPTPGPNMSRSPRATRFPVEPTKRPGSGGTQAGCRWLGLTERVTLSRLQNSSAGCDRSGFEETRGQTKTRRNAETNRPWVERAQEPCRSRGVISRGASSFGLIKLGKEPPAFVAAKDCGPRTHSRRAVALVAQRYGKRSGSAHLL